MICEKCSCDLVESLNHLTRRQIAELMVKAVMDKRLPDVLLFRWEGTAMTIYDLTNAEKEILTDYYLEKSGTKHKHKEDPKAKRFLRPIAQE